MRKGVEIATGQKWDGKSKNNLGRTCVVTEVDAKNKRVRVFEQGARSTDRWMKEESLRTNWRVQGAPPPTPRQKRVDLLAAPLIVDRNEELALLRRSVEASEKMVDLMTKAWGIT